MLHHLPAAADAADTAATITATNARFQAVIDAAAAAGGGVVEAGPGIHLLSGIQLRSQVVLRLAAGSRLVAATDPLIYLRLPVTSQIFGASQRCLIGALDAHGVGIEGPGEIDLRGVSCMDWQSVRNGDHLPATALAQLTPEQLEQTTITSRERPENGILFHRCTGVRLQGFTVRDSPCFTITLSACVEVMIRDLRLRNSLRVPNSDGLHLSGCRDVTVSGCDIVAGDDALAITAVTASTAGATPR